MAEERTVLLDGSCGSLLWRMAAERGLPQMPPWRYTMEYPELVADMHRRFVSVGCDMVQTNTFSLNRIVAAKTPYSVGETVKAAVSVAKAAVAGSDTKVYLSTGSLPKLMEPYGELSEEEVAAMYAEIFAAADGVSAIMLETFMDLDMLCVAAAEAVRCGVPVIATMSFERGNRTLFGNRIPDICEALEELGVASVGMNCSGGPTAGLAIIREFSECTGLPLCFKPNSGLPDALDPDAFAAAVAPALPYVRYVGGCCGTDERYLSALKQYLSR